MENIVNLKVENHNLAAGDYQVVVFKLGKEEYAVNVLNVQEINRISNITRVPKTSDFIEGVINLRGNIVPVINLYKKFGLENYSSEDEKTIIIFMFGEEQAGIIVDEVSEVLRVNVDDIEETAQVYDSLITEHIMGIAKVDERLLILLDLFKILEL
ncbi:MAG TPA: chemotaxis protein CheW [Syntrophomonadaceae bacterium]|nr:chemotaxis protein CheW [Syntrophomonadaceae bacterium]